MRSVILYPRVKLSNDLHAQHIARISWPLFVPDFVRDAIMNILNIPSSRGHKFHDQAGEAMHTSNPTIVYKAPLLK